MAISAPADKRFRRARVKPVRKRNRRGLGWRAFQVGLLLAGIGYAGYRTAVLVEHAAILHIDRIVVSGNARLTTGEVVALLDGLKGRNILTADLAEWRLRLLTSSWVRDATFRRMLPATVEVDITERHPLGIGRIDDDLYLVDSDGVVIDEYGPAYGDVDLPLIRGFVGSDRPDSRDVNAPRAALAARMLSALSRRDMAARVSEVDVSDRNNAAVILEGDTALIKLGRERFSERLQSYLELASSLRERVPDIDYVDLRFDERVYVRAVDAASRP